MSTSGIFVPEVTLPTRVVSVPHQRAQRRVEEAVLTEAVMTEVALVPFASGLAAVFTTPSPTKPTPNEDVAAILPSGPRRGILAVADGLGGHAGGERASRLAVETIQHAMRQAFDAAGETDGDLLRGAILNGIEAANDAVRDLGTGAATTLALVEVDGPMIRTYHVGDSAILLTGQRGKLKLQTIAHSPIGYAVEAGLIDEEDAMSHDQRHVISNVIGSDQMRIEIGPVVEMAPRDTLVLASDGLLDNLLPAEIVDFARTGPLDRAVGEMVDEARRRMARGDGQAPSKPDDLTVIAYRLS